MYKMTYFVKMPIQSKTYVDGRLGPHDMFYTLTYSPHTRANWVRSVDAA